MNEKLYDALRDGLREQFDLDASAVIWKKRVIGPMYMLFPTGYIDTQYAFGEMIFVVFGSVQDASAIRPSPYEIARICWANTQGEFWAAVRDRHRDELDFLAKILRHVDFIPHS